MTYNPSAYPPPRLIRSTSKYRTAQRQFKDRCRRVNAGCYWCCLRGDVEMAAINYDAPANTPCAFELDHLHPIESHPELAFDPSNWVSSHSRCNRQKGTKPLEKLERHCDWVKPDW